MSPGLYVIEDVLKWKTYLIYSMENDQAFYTSLPDTSMPR